MIFQVLTNSLDMIAAQWDILSRAFERLALDIDTAARTDPGYAVNAAAQNTRRALVAPPLGSVAPLPQSWLGICQTESAALRAFNQRAENVSTAPDIRIRHTIRRVRASRAILFNLDTNLELRDLVNDSRREWAPRLPDPALDDAQYSPQALPANLGPNIRTGFEAAATGFGVPPASPATPILTGFAFAVEMCRERIDDLQRFLARQHEDLIELNSEPGFRANVAGIRSGVEDLGSFPILTTDLGSGGGGGTWSGGSGRAGTAGGYRVTIEAAFRQVIGRVPRTADARSFVAALTQSFEVAEIDGGTQYKWLPRTFAGAAELGGQVTGAQASMYSQASAGLDRALRLLEGLKPLDATADPEEMDAIRAIIRTDLTQIVTELKIEGGPRVPRVNKLFELLAGRETAPLPLNSPNDSHLGQFRTRFGYIDANINTLEEEGIASDFISVQDYVLSVRTSWINFRNTWQGQDLGSRFVLLSRALSVVADSVQEVYSAMDSVFVGTAERQVATFPLRRTSGGRTGNYMSVEELLTWIVSFATDEAPKLIHDGGRRGVLAIQPTAVLLEELVGDLLAAGTVPSGLRHPRVRRPLEEVRGFLDQIQQLAEDVRKPLRAVP